MSVPLLVFFNNTSTSLQ